MSTMQRQASSPQERAIERRLQEFATYLRNSGKATGTTSQYVGWIRGRWKKDGLAMDDIEALFVVADSTVNAQTRRIRRSYASAYSRWMDKRRPDHHGWQDLQEWAQGARDLAALRKVVVEAWVAQCRDSSPPSTEKAEHYTRGRPGVDTHLAAAIQHLHEDRHASAHRARASCPDLRPGVLSTLSTSPTEHLHLACLASLLTLLPAEALIGACWRHVQRRGAEVWRIEDLAPDDGVYMPAMRYHAGSEASDRALRHLYAHHRARTGQAPTVDTQILPMREDGRAWTPRTIKTACRRSLAPLFETPLPADLRTQPEIDAAAIAAASVDPFAGTAQPSAPIDGLDFDAI